MKSNVCPQQRKCAEHCLCICIYLCEIRYSLILIRDPSTSIYQAHQFASNPAKRFMENLWNAVGFYNQIQPRPFGFSIPYQTNNIL